MRQKESLRFNIFINSIYEILKIITPFITTPYISRVLGASGVGIYSYTNSVVAYFTMISALGTGFYGQREIARCRDNPVHYSRTFWEVEIITVFTTVVMTSCWLMLCICYKEYRIYLLVLTLNIVATVFDIGWFFTGLEKYIYTVSINSIFKISSVIAVFLLVKDSNDVLVYTVIYSLATLMGNASMWIFLPRILKKCKPEFASLTLHLKSTIIYFIPTIATTIYAVLDKTLIGLLMSGTKEVIDEYGVKKVYKIAELENGYYEQANKIINIVKVFAFSSVNSVLASRSSYLYGKNDEKSVKTLLYRSLDITLFISVGSMFGLIGVASNFVPFFFGDGFDKTIVLMELLSPLLLLLCIENSLSSIYYTPSGKRKQCNYFVIAGCMVNLVLDIPMIIAFNSIGAAIATLIAEAVTMSLFLYHSKGIMKFHDFIIIIKKKLFAGVFMLLTVYGIETILPLNVGLGSRVFVQVVTGIVVYGGILLVLRDSSMQQFKEFVLRKIQK